MPDGPPNEPASPWDALAPVLVAAAIGARFVDWGWPAVALLALATAILAWTRSAPAGAKTIATGTATLAAASYVAALPPWNDVATAIIIAGALALTFRPQPEQIRGMGAFLVGFGSAAFIGFLARLSASANAMAVVILLVITRATSASLAPDHDRSLVRWWSAASALPIVAGQIAAVVIAVEVAVASAITAMSTQAERYMVAAGGVGALVALLLPRGLI